MNDSDGHPYLDSDLEVTANYTNARQHFTPQEPFLHTTSNESDKYIAETEQPVQTPLAIAHSCNHHRNPFGWSPLKFGLMVGLATAVVIGAMVGGAVGGALSSHRSSSPASSPPASFLPASSSPASLVPTSLSSASASASTSALASASASLTPTPTPTSTFSDRLTDYIPSLPPSIQSLHNPCNTTAADGQTYITARAFQTFQISCLNVYADANLAATFVYTLDACIESCSALNFYSNTSGLSDDGAGTCRYVAWSWNLYGTLGVSQSNCWLKGANATLVSSTGDPNTVSAVLVD